MALPNPITREEMFLTAAAGQDVNLPKPITREETFLAAIAGMDVNIPTPETRKEMYLAAIAENTGGGGGAETNPNTKQTVSGTVANPFGGVNLEDLIEAILSENASAIITIDATNLGIATDIRTYLTTTSTEGITVNGASVNDGVFQSFVLMWSPSGVLQVAQMLMGNTVADLSTYASVMPTNLDILWHPLND